MSNLVRVEVEGLRGFGRGSHRGTLHLGQRVTLVYGENSSGKSTLLRALAILPQLEQARARRSWLARGPWFSLGQGWEALHEGDDWLGLRFVFDARSWTEDVWRETDEVQLHLRWSGDPELELARWELHWGPAACRLAQCLELDTSKERGRFVASGPLRVAGELEAIVDDALRDLARHQQTVTDLQTLARGRGVAGATVAGVDPRRLLSALWTLDSRFLHNEFMDEIWGVDELAGLLRAEEGDSRIEARDLVGRVERAVDLARGVSELTDSGRLWLGGLDTVLSVTAPLGFEPDVLLRGSPMGSDDWHELVSGVDHSSASVVLAGTQALYAACEHALYELFDDEEGILLLDYLAAQRLAPARVYPATAESAEPTGSGTVRKLRDRGLQANVSERMQRLFGLRLSVQPLYSRHGSGDPRPAGVLELRVTEPEGASRNIVDVGLGIAQTLPMLVVGSDRNIVVVEEPESNLHPTVQARLIEELVSSESARARFILETHSEHILQRILQLIEEGVLKDEDVAINYVTREGHRSFSRRVRTRRGRLLDPLLPQDRDSGQANPTLSMI